MGSATTPFVTPLEWSRGPKRKVTPFESSTEEGAVSVERRRDATAGNRLVPRGNRWCCHASNGRRGATADSRRTTAGCLAFAADDGSVAVVGITLGAETAIAGITSRGSPVVADAPRLAVTDGNGTTPAHAIDPSGEEIEDTREGVSAATWRGSTSPSPGVERSTSAANSRKVVTVLL